MIKDNQKTLNKLHVIFDAILITLSYLLAFYIRFHSPLTYEGRIFATGTAKALAFEVYAESLLFLIPAYLVIYYYCHLYDPKRSKLKKMEVFQILKANTIGIVVFTFLLYFRKQTDYARAFISLFYVINITFSVLFRLFVAYVLKTVRKTGYNLKHIILVGYSRAAESYIDRIFANPEWGYYIHGILDDNLEVGTLYKKVAVVGKVSELDKFLKNNTLDEIALTLSINEYEKLEHLVEICEKSGVHTKFIPDYHNFIPTRPYTEDLYGLPVINIRNVPLSNTFNSLMKRAIDIFGASVALIIFGIPMLIVALIIKLSSKGPVIFSQIRVGRHNQEFKMYKFRSMNLQPEAAEKKEWTTKNDPRVTPIGKLIRKTSIDELPQLFNVLKGDMSLIGPRPERPFFVEKFKEEIPRYMIKHQVRPGMTGWAQVNGFRGDTSIRKRIDCDLYYIENWSMSLDFKILFLTVFRGFVNKNAY